MHLLDRTLLMRIVMEAIGARDHVEGTVGERQPLAITLDRRDMPPMGPPAQRPLDSIAATRSTPQTFAWGKASRIRGAKTPVPHPTSRIIDGRSPIPSRIRVMMARCAGRNNNHWRILRS